MTLNPKQARFVEEYILDLNATQAAIRAGYSAATAYSQGGRLLKHVEVCAAIAERQEEVAQKHEVTVDSIAAELDLAYKASAKFKQGGAMVAAAMGKAKLFGLITDKSTVDQTTRYVARMPDPIDEEDEWLDKHAPAGTPKGNGSTTVQ